MFGLPAPISKIIERQSQQAELPIRDGRTIGSLWFVMFLSGLAKSGYLSKVVEAQRAAARNFEANAIFTDIDPAAYLTARIEGLPMAANYSEVMKTGMGGFTWERMNAAIAPILKAHQQSPCTIDELFFSPRVLKIIPSIPELDGADEGRPDVRYMGKCWVPFSRLRASLFSPNPVSVLFLYIWVLAR